MSREIMEKIFEPFFTTKEMGKGTGLGLATVYGIVKQNDGFITADSQPGLGTTFTIYLPRHSRQEPVKQMEHRYSGPRGKGECVLLVEDEAAILRLTRKILENAGYKVLTADTPSRALVLAGEHAAEIVLLLTDVVMPEMNGKDLANQLKTIIPQLKCLFMSGYTASVIAGRGVLDEGTHFIQKPFSAEGLAVKVREAIHSCQEC
jgi:CheY-like chemotaxis protein